MCMTEQTVTPRLADLIARRATRLTEADSRLLDVLIQNPVRAAMENGREISARAGVHPASAVRLARRLGFDGYPELRAFLQSDLVTEIDGDFDNPATRVTARLLRAENGGLLSSLLDSEIAALQQVRNTVSDTDIRAFAETLRDARRVFLFGQGHGAALSALIALRLRRSGCESVDLAVLPNLAETLSTLGAQDVLWLLSFRGPGPTTQALRKVADQRGAKVLLLSDVNGLRIEPPPHLGIAVSRGGIGQSQSLVVPMTVANAVILDLATIDGGRSLRSLDNFRAFRDSLPSGIPR
jgi:DNA-binding MurR/RpiR family transcriptional regulator